MKNKEKSKKSIAQLTDFFIILSLITATVLGVLFASRILYGTPPQVRTVHIETELIPDIHGGKLSEGDEVYDTVSKRVLGRIENLTEQRHEDKIRYRFTVKASQEPRCRALRTKRLWFYFKEVSE